MLRYFLIAAAVVFGGTAVALYVHEKNRPVPVIREAQLAPPVELQPEPQQQEPKRDPAQENKKVIRNMDSLAGKVDGILEKGPKFKGR